VLAAALVLGAAAPGLSAPRQATADLKITWSKSPRGRIVQPGAMLRYVVTVTNAGPDAAGGVTAEMGIVFEGATIKAAGTSDGGHCSNDNVLPGIGVVVNCPMGTINAGASKTMTIQIKANSSAVKTGGAVYVATLAASSDDTTDPDDSNSLLPFFPDDSIQYSISGKLGGGKATARRIRARVLIAPEGSQSRSVQRYRRVEVFHAPPGSRVELRARRIVETGQTGRSGKLVSRRLVNRPLAVGSLFTVTVTKRGRIGDVLRIKVVAGGAALVGRQCVPSGGGPPRSSCH
jgi:hypothetical protein